MIFTETERGYRRVIFLLITMLLLSAFMSIGSTLNSKVYEENDCQMPILSGISGETWNVEKSVLGMKFASTNYFFYKEGEQVDYPLLTDRIPFGRFKMSIGDILIFIPSMAMVIIFIIMSFFWIKNEREIKRRCKEELN